MYKTYSQYNTNGNVYPQAIDERNIYPQAGYPVSNYPQYNSNNWLYWTIFIRRTYWRISRTIFL